MDSKIGILEELAETWNKGGCRYTVTNGLQGYPESIGRDLDICFEARDLKLALALTVEFLEGKGFMVLPYHLAWVYWVVGIRENADGSIDSVQVDLFDHLQWAFCWIIDGVPEESECYHVGPFQTDHWSPVAKRLILNALSGNQETFQKKPHYLDTSATEREAMARHFQRISGDGFPGLEDAILKRDIALIQSEMVDFRSAVMKHSLTRWQKLSERIFSAFQKQWCVNFMPRITAPIVSINGADVDRLKNWTEGLSKFLESHFVFTFDQVRRISTKPEGKSGVITWWNLVKNHVLRVRKRSALQVVQIFQNHPSGNPHSQVLGKWNFLKGALPRPSLVLNLGDYPDIRTKEEFQEVLTAEMLKWFEGASVVARKRLGLGAGAGGGVLEAGS
ncbi:hypothetical protein OAF84_02555 [Akkermansiaceae bacterium]|nr:hypothetical protein [Akkermansiaceae bacterium]